MTSEVEAEISEAMYDRVAGHEFSRLLPICWPGVVFQVPSGTPYLDVRNSFSRADQIGLGDAGEHRYLGFMRVDVVWPSGGDGELPPLRLAAEVVSLFRRGTVVSTLGTPTRSVRVLTPPQITGPLESSEWIRVPVTIRWQSDNPNVS